MAADNLEDCRIAAIEGIGALKAQDSRIFHVLIEGMDHDDPAIRLSCYRALKQITGKDLGSTPDPWRRALDPQAVSTDKPGDVSGKRSSKEDENRGDGPRPASTPRRRPFPTGR